MIHAMIKSIMKNEFINAIKGRFEILSNDLAREIGLYSMPKGLLDISYL